jgi:hypothetical protein
MEVEKNILIAERVIGKGDTWKLLGGESVHPSLTEMLNEYYIQSTIKSQAYRLEPMNGKVFAIVSEHVEEPQPKKYSIYGNYEF